MNTSTFLLLGAAFCAGVTCSAVRAAAPADAVQLLDHAPLRFEPASDRAAFVARGARYRFQFSKNRAMLETAGGKVSLRFQGADPNARPDGQEKLRSTTSLFFGNDPAAWRQHIDNYGRLRVSGIYPGVDLVYYGNAGELEYDLNVAPGADPGRIRLRLAGARAKLDRSGDLIAALVQKRPVAYQMDEHGARVPVQSCYRRNADGSFGFALGAYNHNRELVIDPVLTLSAYFGGSNQDIAYAVGHDQIGFLYIAGTTNSSDFPVSGNASQKTAGGSGDVFVAKIDPHAAPGSQLVFATYLGGNSAETFGGMAVSPRGDVYLAGGTQSTNFPATSGGFQTSFKSAPNTHGWLAWIDSNQNLAYASYIEGSGSDVGTGIAIAPNGTVWVTGGTESNDFPNAGGIQSGRTGLQDIFIAGFDPTQSGGNSLLYSSLLGSSGWDIGRGIAVAADGTVWIAGGSYYYDAPVQNGYQLSYRGGGDAYVAHINPALGSSGLLYATYLGGSDLDDARKIVLDPAGLVIVTGYTNSSNFPVTGNALQTSYGGNTDGFIAILNPASPDRASQLVYSTYFGGAGPDVPFDLKRDPNGLLYISGMTMSAGLPASAGALQASYDGSMDAFLLRLNPSRAGTAGIDYFTYLGSDGVQVGYGVDFDSAGNTYVVGSTSGPIFDKLGGVGKISPAGKTDIFVAGIGTCGFGISPTSQQFAAAGGSATVNIGALGGGCAWSASSNLDWITVSPASGSGSGQVTITASANTTGAARQGTISIAGASFQVGQGQ
ncbi:MAG TPA: SBBP repeat-containing protein [Bryobacteraceae bacterium]|nr:SBBP repeat-containing protein [Bryobacteraceae bacterium]